MSTGWWIFGALVVGAVVWLTFGAEWGLPAPPGMCLHVAEATPGYFGPGTRYFKIHSGQECGYAPGVVQY